ncbi:PfkB family carbohydrate kinase [Microbacterium sp. 4R-513]|uniref:1-phosphofructokinase family hexose kinase n=1 Tax=Microbacterium sp. 4R-513 TaxID=2567934 RepID=UPI001F496C56|nr:PfkB family carbohydrate kinase [Microbacterium sp. 4R-513]
MPRLSRGGTHRVSPAVARAGGKGINVARVLHELGHDVLALATAGGSTGEQFTADLDESGIPYQLIATGSATRLSAAIVEEEPAETAIFNEDGTPLTRVEGERLAAAAEAHARSAAAVAISGSLRAGFGPDELRHVVERVARWAPVVVDTSGPGILSAADGGAHVLKPNREELRAATGLDDPGEGARRLLARGARLVIVSSGPDGLLLVAASGDVISARLPFALRGNATGAGDALVAAIAAGLASGVDLLSSDDAAHTARLSLARRAAAWSGAAVLMPLAGELSPEHLTLEHDVVVTSRRGAA